MSVEEPHRLPAVAMMFTVPAFSAVMRMPPVDVSCSMVSIVGSDAPHCTAAEEMPFTTAGIWYLCDDSYAEYIGAKTISSALDAQLVGAASVPPSAPPPELVEQALTPSPAAAIAAAALTAAMKPRLDRRRMDDLGRLFVWRSIATLPSTRQ